MRGLQLGSPEPARRPAVRQRRPLRPVRRSRRRLRPVLRGGRWLSDQQSAEPYRLAYVRVAGRHLGTGRAPHRRNVRLPHHGQHDRNGGHLGRRRGRHPPDRRAEVLRGNGRLLRPDELAGPRRHRQRPRWRQRSDLRYAWRRDSAPHRGGRQGLEPLLLNRDNLGGIGHELLKQSIATNQVKGAPAVVYHQDSDVRRVPHRRRKPESVARRARTATSSP